MFGLSPAQMIILLVVILLVFGTKKLRNALKKRCLMTNRKKMLSLLKLKTVQLPLKKLKL